VSWTGSPQRVDTTHNGSRKCRYKALSRTGSEEQRASGWSGGPGTDSMAGGVWRCWTLPMVRNLATVLRR
jgi:hypothetical protein